jgi:Arc/MetJ family transcription regulator
MRTNIVLDAELVERAQQLTGIKTKRALVDEALRTLIRVHEQTAIRALRGKLRWEGDLEAQREGRFNDPC